MEKVSDKVIARAARALRGDPSLPNSHDLQAVLVRCWTRALGHFCRSYDTKTGAFAERLYLNDIVKLCDDLAKAGLQADLGDFDQARLRIALSDPSMRLDRTNTIDLIAFLETHLGSMPDGIRSALLDGIPPDCPGWSSCFSLFVTEEMKSSPKVFQIFVTERLATIEALAEASAQTTDRIETSLGDLARTSTETGHDIRWIVDRLKQLPSLDDTDLTEIAAFFGIFDADGAAAARKAIMVKARELGVLKDRVVEYEAAERELTRIAFVDHLTGAPNRSHFYRELGDRSRRTDNAAFVRHLAFLDIDGFHQINNAWGHDAGDHVLSEIARRLQDLALASEAIFCRYGGDEFLLGFEAQEVETERLQNLAEAARKAVSAPISYLAQTLRVTASVGLSADDADVVIERSIKSADLALYRAKESGRDRAVLFEQRFHEDVEERRALEVALRTAIENEELRLRYAPVVDLATENIVGFEALVRWHNPDRGWISPVTFVPVAEECGLIRLIGDWVLRTACADATQWLRPIPVAVNISPLQWDESLIGNLQSVLAETRLSPERLELEVTESIFLIDTAECFALAKQIDALGIGLVLDDFGTGFSSLSCLGRTPFKSIKIDQSFIRSAVGGDAGSSAIIHGTVTMARALEIEITAEGIETEADLLLAKELGCTRAQGFYFAKPMDAEAVRQAIS
ncbi:putative signal transduction protein [Sphingobium indicum UT26S]|uniref:Putative signal transduction protein n=1 Tax=Sphingobium indicum (strain DSM 16413 / CCM 7287 / MTCC 6362 / UT26 / NBRC 101211 / UT26S) TaxID=452662 RepID=D4YXV9_SPHIU|nr:putative signal transduction protein [Sphingobium indicum UT26S]